jgi:hypothetical protein
MKPQYVTHAPAPHARVKCVACHVGAGPASAAKAKLDGTRRLIATLTGTYSRPVIATPEQLITSAETCEQCHSPEVSYGDRRRRVVSYADDEASTESVTTLLVHVGGGATGSATGAHWHADPANQVEYIATDAARQTIPYVRVTDRDGIVREFRTDDAPSGDVSGRELRRMECTDCHNRPNHGTSATPERAVDDAISRGDLSRSLPFVHREAVAALGATYPSEEAALRDIPQVLRDFYLRAAPGRDLEVAAATRAIEDVYRRNVFPEMNVRFGTYPSNIGHTYAPGCFRCHDGAHASSDGRTIPQDCEACHLIE